MVFLWKDILLDIDYEILISGKLSNKIYATIRSDNIKAR